MTSGTPRRVLVVSTEGWDAASSQLVATAAAISARGDHVVLAAPEQTLAAWRGVCPEATAERVLTSDGVRHTTAALRELVAAHRLDAALVIGDLAHRASAAALGAGGAILRRTPLFTSTVPLPLATRLALRRAPSAVLVPDVQVERAGRPLASAGARARALHLNIPLVVAPLALAEAPPIVLRGDPPSVLQDDHGTCLLLVPDAHNPLASLPALRAAARLLRRHPEQHVYIVGPSDVTQPLRVQAAALGVAQQVSAGLCASPWLADAPPVAAAWIDAEGDTGAVAVVGCLVRGAPVLLSSNSPLCPLVPHGAAGLHMVLDSTLGSASAQLARLFATRNEWEALRDGAFATARRAHDPARLADVVCSTIDRLRSERSRAA